jgi:hypothetical protein
MYSKNETRYGLAWIFPMIEMVIEMLSHRTPPSSISPMILMVLDICVLCWKFVKALPSNNWIRQCCTLLVFITKTLAAMKLGFGDRVQAIIHGRNKLLADTHTKCNCTISRRKWIQNNLTRHSYKCRKRDCGVSDWFNSKHIQILWGTTQ